MGYSGEVPSKEMESQWSRIGSLCVEPGPVGVGQGRYIYPLKSEVISLKLPEILKAYAVSRHSGSLGFQKLSMKKTLGFTVATMSQHAT